MGNQNVCPSRLFIALNSNCYLASKKRHQHRGVDLKNPLHKSRCTFQKMFSVGLYLRESISYLFRYESRSIIVLFYSYELLYFTPLLCYFMIFNNASTLSSNLILLDHMNRDKGWIPRKHDDDTIFSPRPHSELPDFFFVKASCFEKDLVLPWLREINPRERAEEVMLSASNCSLFFLAKQSILVEFMSDSVVRERVGES